MDVKQFYKSRGEKILQMSLNNMKNNKLRNTGSKANDDDDDELLLSDISLNSTFWKNELDISDYTKIMDVCETNDKDENPISNFFNEVISILNRNNENDENTENICYNNIDHNEDDNNNNNNNNIISKSIINNKNNNYNNIRNYNNNNNNNNHDENNYNMNDFENKDDNNNNEGNDGLTKTMKPKHNKNYKIKEFPESSDDDEINSDSEIFTNAVDEDEIDCNIENKQPDMNIKKLLKSTDWIKTNSLIDYPSYKFLGIENPLTNEDIDQLNSPIEIFKYFFSNDMLDYITEQTIKYSIQVRPEQPVKINRKEIECFIGIIILMSLIKISNSRLYWANNTKINLIANNMSIKKFEEIKKFIHFVDNNKITNNNDKLKKIRPLMDQLKNKFNKINKEEKMSVDEQIIPFKGRSSLKQYNPQKPHKWGYKMFILAGVSGFCYDFEFYAGGQNNMKLDGEIDCGASGNIVTRMSRTIPININHKLYFDNYFNSPLLQFSLSKNGIQSVGTIRWNRTGLKKINEKQFKKNERGYLEERHCEVDGVKMFLISWYDNKIVNLLSTYSGVAPVGSASRWCKKKKTKIQVTVPNVIQHYNKHMGGVDLLDSLIGMYRINIKSKKWYQKIFGHLIDLVLVNAWIIYKNKNKEMKKSEKMLRNFKLKIAEDLCNTGVRPRGRPSNDEEAPPPKKICSERPIMNIRKDGLNHWPQWSDVRQRCKYEECAGISRVKCSKCQVALCFNQKNNCFEKYHN